MSASSPNSRPAPPQEWLPGLVGQAALILPDQALRGIQGGPGWLLLPTAEGSLWVVARGPLRMAWLDRERLASEWLDLLGRHGRHPFAVHLRDARLLGAELLVAENGTADGLRVALASTAGRLQLGFRFFPRPGAFWLEDAKGEILARSGRMEGEDLRAVSAAAPMDEDAARAHAQLCRESLQRELLREAQSRLLSQRRSSLKKDRTLLAKLQVEASEGAKALELRGDADLLAAHLHQLSRGMDSVELVDFDGNPRRLTLDPALPPHRNLERAYHRAGRAERKATEVKNRLLEVAERVPLREAALRAAEGVEDLAGLIAAYGKENLRTLAKEREPAHEKQKRQREERFPYWTWRLASGREVRVGRNARDNDELTFRHSHLKDRWLHAQGVPGSHVVLRCAGEEVSPQELEEAAMLAANYSKAKDSATVAVVCTERRHVRKLRKGKPGQVTLQHGQTIFVSPGIPAKATRED